MKRNSIFHIHMHKSIQCTTKFEYREFIGQFNNVLLMLWQAKLLKAYCIDFYRAA